MHSSERTNDLPPRVQLLVASEVRNPEAITWLDTPIPHLLARRTIPKCLFGAAFATFSIVWMAAASDFRWPWNAAPVDMFPLFGLPFLAVGLVLFCSPLWMMRQARKTAYVITSQRAIVFTVGYSNTVRSFVPTQLNDLTRTKNANGSGDLIFKREVSYDSEGAKGVLDFGFLAIRNVDQVDGLIRELASNACPTK